MKKNIFISSLIIASIIIITSPSFVKTYQVIIQGVYQISGAANVVGPNLTLQSGQYLGPDGTSLLPTYSFTSQPSIGFYRSSASVVGLSGALSATAGATVTGGNLIAISTLFGSAPTITSGGCTSPSILWSRGAQAFAITIGTICTGVKTIIIALPAIQDGWACHIEDNTTPASFRLTATTTSASAVTISNWSETTGLAIDFVASEVLVGSCFSG